MDAELLWLSATDEQINAGLKIEIKEILSIDSFLKMSKSTSLCLQCLPCETDRPELFSQILIVWWRPAEELGSGSNRSGAVHTTKAAAVIFNGRGHPVITSEAGPRSEATHRTVNGERVKKRKKSASETFWSDDQNQNNKKSKSLYISGSPEVSYISINTFVLLMCLSDGRFLTSDHRVAVPT